MVPIEGAITTIITMVWDRMAITETKIIMDSMITKIMVSEATMPVGTFKISNKSFKTKTSTTQDTKTTINKHLKETFSVTPSLHLESSAPKSVRNKDAE